MEAVAALEKDIGLAPWSTDEALARGDLKRAIAKHKKETVRSSLQARDERVGGASPVEFGGLPWAWLAEHGDTSFQHEGFDLWWQIRVLGVSTQVPVV